MTFNKHLMLSLSAAFMLALPAAAQDDEAQEIFRLDALARVDWQSNSLDGHTMDSETGFRGKYLMLRMDGQIAPGLTYSWRQRLNSSLASSEFFDATDWIYLNYAVKGWSFAAGKEVVAIGGFEYDRHPADLYACSEYWNNVACYQLGASVGYQVAEDDKLTLQAVQSPYRKLCHNNNTYGYSLMWNGHHGCFDAIWTVNAMEYEKGRYINYISLGNKLTFGDFAAEIDFMNRYTSGQTFLFKDCTVIGDLSYRFAKRWKVHAKYSYDVNESGTNKDTYVINGTHLNMAGGGVEFYPLLKDRTALRLHATCYYAWGRNTNLIVGYQNKQLYASVGLTWNMNLLSVKAKSKK